MEKTAIQFLKEIEAEKDKYRLVNGLFIVKYFSEEISVFIGDFLKAGSALNEGKTNKVIFNPSPQTFNASKGLVTNARGDSWRKLEISFNEKPITEILK